MPGAYSAVLIGRQRELCWGKQGDLTDEVEQLMYAPARVPLQLLEQPHRGHALHAPTVCRQAGGQLVRAEVHSPPQAPGAKGPCAPGGTAHGAPTQRACHAPSSLPQALAPHPWTGCAHRAPGWAAAPLRATPARSPPAPQARAEPPPAGRQQTWQAWARLAAQLNKCTETSG